jgi:hypothetical protein
VCACLFIRVVLASFVFGKFPGKDADQRRMVTDVCVALCMSTCLCLWSDFSLRHLRMFGCAYILVSVECVFFLVTSVCVCVRGV